MRNQLSLQGKPYTTAKSVEKPVKKSTSRAVMQIQDNFLKGAIGKGVTVYCLDGESISGSLKFFDKFVLLVEITDKMKFFVYKSGISKIGLEE